jgi:hypothetical protein
MKLIIAFVFHLFILQSDSLLERIKADSDYKIFVDTQDKIKNGLRSRHFTVPSDMIELLQTTLKTPDMELWNKVLREKGMVNSEEYVRLHFLQVNSMIKVASKFQLEIMKLPPEKRTKLFLEMSTF